MGLPVSLPLMYLAIVAMGFGLGIAATLTFSEVVMLAPRDARATALSLRLTGNRIGQLMVPVLASLIAEVTGIGGVLIIIAGVPGGVRASRCSGPCGAASCAEPQVISGLFNAVASSHNTVTTAALYAPPAFRCRQFPTRLT